MRNLHKSLPLQERYDNLQAHCLEMSEYIQDQSRELERAYSELRYLHEFISYKGLSEEYSYFEENAHEEYDKDCPFPRLTL